MDSVAQSAGKPTVRLRPPYVLAAILLVIGGLLAWQGGVLLSLGGSPYYLLAGIAMLASGVLALRGKRLAAHLYGLMLAATVAWAIWEAGFDGWALAPRIGAPLALGLWFILPRTKRRLDGKDMAREAVLGLGLGSVLLGTGLHAAFAEARPDPLYQTGPAGGALRAVANAKPDAAGDWVHYGNDPGGTRYSPLDQITPANIGKLKVAWTFRFGPGAKGAPDKLQVTPIKIGDTVYACSADNDIVALDAETGRQKWRFNSHTDTTGAPHGACRGVSYHAVKGASGACATRIYTNTIDARLIAVDAATGAICTGFGKGGIVDLKEGMGTFPKGYYYPSSAPTIVRGRIVLGGWVFDNNFWGEPSGVIRAFDAVTGQLSWAFDLGRPDRHGAPPPGESYTPSTPNSWAPMSADPELGLVYVPMGGAINDYSGVNRRKFDEEWSGSIVALDAETGIPRWKFQTVRHDLWDYDNPAQPTLVDWPTQQGLRKAVIQPTKRGELFVLDRATGQPVMPVTDHPAPTRGAYPGEPVSPTQPFSDGLPSFRGPPVTEQQMWGLTPLDQLACRIMFRKARYDGPLTPPGLTPAIVSPGFLGGMDWGGVSVDTERQVMIVNTNHMANYLTLVPRAEADRQGARPFDPNKPPATGHSAGMSPMIGAPVAVALAPFLSPIFAPCQQPPWGKIAAVDLVTHKVLWSHRLGTAYDSGPFTIPSRLPFRIGSPNLGGAVTTRGGVFFIAATQDRFLRGFDEATGEVLWRARLPAGGQSTPMTYRSPTSGRQFVVVAAGGHTMLVTKPGDYLIAYALPKEGK